MSDIEAVFSTPPDTSSRDPLAAVDVYVDDFLLLAQTEHNKQRVMREALYSIDNILRPLTASDPPHRKEPASVKKMLKGDACSSEGAIL